jgi:uncharacterized repeat protein (TIGR02543 family)
LLSPVTQLSRNAQQILPSVTGWEIGAEHGAGVYLGLEIPEAQTGDPDYFVEPRNAPEFFIVIQFAEPFPPENFREATILVAENEAGTRSFTSLSPEWIDPETGTLYVRAPAPTGPTTFRFRIFDPTGVVISERSFAVIPGDVNGDGVVNIADNEGPTAMDGVNADENELAIRSDVDVSGTVEATADGADVTANHGDTSPGDPPDFEDPESLTATISFAPDPDDLGVIGSIPAITDNVGETITLPADSSLDLPGYTFTEWNTEPDGSGVSYLPGPNLTLTGPNLTLYAQWSSGAAIYTVTYFGNGNDGGTVPVDSTTYTYADPVPIADPGALSLTGHYFDGWNTVGNGSGTQYDLSMGTFNMPDQNVTLYAQWTPNFAGGDGTGVNPYVITTPQGLDAIRNDITASYQLGANIEMNVWPYNVGSGWDPIASSATPFTGSLDGNGYVISNLFISDNDVGSGLFATVDGATFTSVGLEDVNIFNSNNNTGGLAGSVLGAGTVIENSYVTGTFASNGYNMGGLVGYVDDSSFVISNSFADATLSTNTSFATGGTGGLIGRSTGGTVQDSYFLGSVNSTGTSTAGFGGLVGVSGTDIINAYVVASVSVGAGNGPVVGSNGGTVTDSYYNVDVATVADNGTGIGLISTAILDSGNFGSWDFMTTWDNDANTTYPYLRWQPSGIGSRP